MEWIKVTPETMPPDMEPIMVTVEPYERNGFLFRYVPKSQARYNKRKDLYEIYTKDRFSSRWSRSELIGDRVTHWMPYPEPAED